MITVMILIRHVKNQSIHLLHQDRVIIIASVSITVVHRHRVHTKNRVDAAQAAAAVIVVAIRDIQIDLANIQDVNGHRVDRATAVTANVINIHTKEVIREVTATNIVDIELISMVFGHANRIDFQQKKNFPKRIFASNFEAMCKSMNSRK